LNYDDFLKDFHHQLNSDLKRICVLDKNLVCLELRFGEVELFVC